MRRLSLLVLLVALLGIIPYRAGGAEIPLDYPIANGHFFKQANGLGGAGDAGYAVTDEGGILFWTWFRDLGGVPELGYPVSQRFLWKTFTVQAFQKVIFQWRPETKSVAFVNTFDELAAAGKDDWLSLVRSVPKAADWSSDGGKAWEQVVQNHFRLMSPYAPILNEYFSVYDPVNMNGLPMAVQDYEDFVVVRAQRKTYQLWKVDVPWAKAGEVTIANGGDVGKEAGLFPQTATTPVNADPAAPVGTTTPGLTATVKPSTTAVPLTSGCGGLPAIASFSASPNPVAMGGKVTLSWGAVTNAITLTVDNGIGSVIAPGSAPTAPASDTVYTMTAIGCGGVVTKSVTTKVTFNPGTTMIAPFTITPAEGAVLRTNPRVTTFYWSPIDVVGDTTYNIEIHVYNTLNWVPFTIMNGLGLTNYAMAPFPGDFQGRWRVWAKSSILGEGPKSAWSYFSFKSPS